MDAEKVNLYEAADKAIRIMNREILKAFGMLKGIDWTKGKPIRETRKAYESTAKKAKRKYYEIAVEAYILGLMLCGIGLKKAHAMAEAAIDMDFVNEWLERPDFVTRYVFDAETERKAERLAEAIEATSGDESHSAGNRPGSGRDAEIDRAVRYWSRQIGQYALNFTDYALIQAYQDAGVPEVMWLTAMDERVCGECGPLHGKVFPIDEVPPKPHWGCRCRLVPAGRKA